VMVGSIHLLAMAVTYGADGSITGMANLVPDRVVALYNAARKRDVDACCQLRDEVLSLMRVARPGASWMALIKAMKTALKLKGIFTANTMTRPFTANDEAEEAEIAKFLAEAGIG